MRDFLRRCAANIRRKSRDHSEELAWEGAALVAILVMLLADDRIRKAVAEQ
jgi:hypothetical protein